MQVIAQTEVPEMPSFMHVGYISSLQDQYGYGSVITITVVGVVMLHVVRRKKWMWRVGVVASVLIWLGFSLVASPPGQHKYPIEATEIRESEIYHAITKLHDSHKQVPTSVRQIEQLTGDEFEHDRDAWGRGFRIKSYMEGCNTEYRVVSSGEDGKFDTGDDVRWPLETKTGNAYQTIKIIYEDVKSAINAGDPVPKGKETKSLQWGMIGCLKEDQWGSSYIVRRDKSGVRVISAGPDRRFDTADDIVYPFKRRPLSKPTKY